MSLRLLTVAWFILLVSTQVLFVEVPVFSKVNPSILAINPLRETSGVIPDAVKSVTEICTN